MGAARIAVVVAVVGMMTAACQATHMSQKETTGTAAGAVVGGVLGGIIDEGDATGILVGTALGGLIGNRIGAYLDKREQQAMARASVKAADSAPTGQKVAWSSPEEEGEDTASGWVVPTTDPYEREGRTCRDLQQVAQKGGRERQQEVTMCRTADQSSDWRIPAT